MNKCITVQVGAPGPTSSRAVKLPLQGCRRTSSSLRSAQTEGLSSDERGVSFWLQAAERVRRRMLWERTSELLETASAGVEACDLTIALGRDGSISMSATSDWSLEQFIRERQAEAGWRIRRRGSSVWIEARSGAACWSMNSGTAGVNPGPPRARNARLLPAAWG